MQVIWKTIRAMGVFIGWVAASVVATLLVGFFLIWMTTPHGSEGTVGQGMLVVMAGLILMPLGVCVALMRAVLCWSDGKSSLRFPRSLRG